MLIFGLAGCLDKTEPLKEFESTATIEQQDLEYCVDGRLTNSPYANSGEVEGTTPSTSFTICTEEQFLNIGKTPTDWNKHFLLKADLDFVHFDLDANHTYSPISVYRTTLSVGDTDLDGIDEVEIDYTEDDHPFTGVFNGNNHTIYRFRATFLNDEENEYKAIGMFPFLSVPGVIKNLKLVKHRVMKSDDDEVEYGMGMLVGYNDGGEIDNVHIESGSMYAGDSRVGGMVGLQGGGRIINSTVEFEDHVQGDDQVGGLVGELSDGLILQCTVRLSQISGDNNIGGLVGYAHRSTVRDSKVYLSGNVEGRENNIGGFVGFNSKGAILYSTVELNSVIGFENVGGFAGENSEGEIHFSSSKALQNIEGSDNFVGGFIGLNTDSPVGNSSSYMKNISGVNYVGGFIGESIESEIKNNEVEIDNLLSVNHHGGGLIGRNTGGMIYGSNVQVLYIEASNQDCPLYATTGGLVGEALDGEESEGRILYSQANITSTISGHGIIGGLVGKSNVEINYSQAISNLIDVEGAAVGGLVGFNYSDGHYQSGRIEHSYVINSNMIVGEGDVGGLVGKNGNYRDLAEELSGANPTCSGTTDDVNGYRMAGGEIQFSYVDGETIYSRNAGNNVGGFIGSGWESRVQASYADIDQSVYGTGYSSDGGAVFPVENIGGFIGDALDSSIRSSFARVGRVYGGYRHVGGFVGQSTTSTFMYNFAVSDVDGYSPEGVCQDEDTTKQYPTEDLCNAVGSCNGDNSYTEQTSCEQAGYCFDPDGVYSNDELSNDFYLDTPESCIQAGACYAFSTSYSEAVADLRGDFESFLPDYSLNIPDDGTDHVDYREMCLASYSCIDANGALVEGANTYEECIRGGMCITTLASSAIDVDEDGGDTPIRYDDGMEGAGGEVTLSDGVTTSTNYLREGSDGLYIRDRSNCCQMGGLEDGNHPHEVRWIANKWVKNYWVPYGFNWTYARGTDGTTCQEWTNDYSWTSTRSEENGSHTIPDVGRFAGGFDFHWSVENERYYHESLWVQNYTSNDTDNYCGNDSSAVVDDQSPDDATEEDQTEVNAYDCTFDSNGDRNIDGADDYTSVVDLDQVSCHDFSSDSGKIECLSGILANNDDNTARGCDCGNLNEDGRYALYRYQQKEFIFTTDDVISCDDVYDPTEAGEENDTSGDDVVDHDEDQTVEDIGTPETCNDSMIMQYDLQDQIRVSYWVDNSEQASSGCEETYDDYYYDDWSEDDYYWYLENTTGRESVEEGECYYERYFYKKENAPLKYWDFYHFWDNHLDKYPTLQKVDE